MIIPESIKKFIRWIQGFDHHLLQNEDDVREKFILPMFDYLCYPEKCHREHLLKISKLEKYSRTSEIAQIYYATYELEQQNTDTSLLFIQAREPQKTKLNHTVEQAKFYSDHFNTLFFIITNGYEIKVFERSYCNQKPIFNINIDALKNHDIALDFYNKLNITHRSLRYLKPSC